MKKSGVKVVAPITIGCVSGQIDLLGLAIDSTLVEVVVTPNSDSNELQIVELTGFSKKQKEIGLQNTTLLGAQTLMKHASIEPVGIDIKIHIKQKNLPETTYISALFMSGAIAINELFRRPFTRRELMHSIGSVASEITPINSEVAPLTIGGIVTTHSLFPSEIHRLIIPQGIQVTYISNLGDFDNNKQSLEAESKVISSLIHGLAMSSFNYIKRALRDQLESYPDFLKEILEMNQDLDLLGGIFLAKSNSAIILSANTLVADKLHHRVQQYMEERNNQAVVLTHSINNEGIVLM